MTNSKKLNRRDAIKLLGTAAGASAFANLPARWSKPEISGSSLPAHAQTSCGVGLLVEMNTASVTANPIMQIVEGPLIGLSGTTYSLDTSFCFCAALALENAGDGLVVWYNYIGSDAPIAVVTGAGETIFVGFDLSNGLFVGQFATLLALQTAMSGSGLDCYV